MFSPLYQFKMGEIVPCLFEQVFSSVADVETFGWMGDPLTGKVEDSSPHD